VIDHLRNDNISMERLRFEAMQLQFLLRQLKANVVNFVWCEPCECDANVMSMRHVVKWLDHMTMARF